MTITDVDFSMDCLIDSFNYEHVAQSDDIEYTLQIIQYKAYTAKPYTATIQTIKNTVVPEARIAEPSKITVGKKVIVNGQLFRDSYGGGAGMTLSNYTGVVSIIKEGKPKPYHITTLDGGWLGWVSESSVKGA